MIIQYGIPGILLFILTIFSINISVGQSDLGKIKCICIDAGHGGKDPGALGTKAKEKDIVLSITLKLGQLIKTTYPDIKVVYTRDKDFYPKLHERSRLANQHKADLFVSIHANSLDLEKEPRNKYIRGVETYIMGLNHSEHNLQVAMKENSVIHYEEDSSLKYEGFDASKPESYIIFNMIKNVYQEQSLMLASMIQASLIKSTRQVDREVRQGPIWVLKDVAMPAVLVEVGYITNPEEERFITSLAGQEKIAKAIFKGFQAYKMKIEKSILPPQTDLETAKIEKVGKSAQSEIKQNRPIYAVQVASAVAKVKDRSNLCSGEKVWELNSEGRFRYYVVPSDNLEEVKGNLKKIKSKVKDCFIIAIYKGKLISVAEARKMEHK